MEFVRHFNLFIDLVFGVVLLGTVAFLYTKKKRTPVYLLFFILFYIYIFKVLDYTLFQFQSLLLLKHFVPNLLINGIEVGKSVNFTPLISLTSEDLKTSLLNILLFVPFGLGLPFISNYRFKGVVVLGILFSILIEFIQYITGLLSVTTFRITDVNDLIFNTVGVVTGYVLFVIFIHILWYVFPDIRNSENVFLRYISKVIID